MEEKNRLHAFVYGKVQGVMFRYFALDTAEKPGLTGWVRNKFDRRVEVMAEGEKENLKKFIRQLERGPERSDVERVDEEWLPATGEYKKFRVRMTR